MTAELLSRNEIAQMQGAGSLPRKSGEMVFHDEWEKRAFSMVVSLAEQGVYDWSEFQEQLIIAVAEAEQKDPQKPTRGYYESWLVAMEALLEKKRLLDQ